MSIRNLCAVDQRNGMRNAWVSWCVMLYTISKSENIWWDRTVSLKKRGKNIKANKINTFGGLLLTDTIAWREIMTCKTLNDSFYYPIIPSLITLQQSFAPNAMCVCLCVVWWQSHNIFIPKNRKIIFVILCVVVSTLEVDSTHSDL